MDIPPIGMTRTEEQFVDLWLDRLVGMSVRGLVMDTDERTKGPFGAGKYALEVPQKCRDLLRRMYRDLKIKEPLK